MKIEFLKPDKTSSTGIKVILQKSGRLSFNKTSVDAFEITGETNIKIGFDVDNPNEKALYLFKTTENDLLGKKVFKSGGKTLLHISFALDKLCIDFRTKLYLTESTIIKYGDSSCLKVVFSELV